jgi:hypothetical protein
MIEFTKPKNLNGLELLAELEAAGIKASNLTIDELDVLKLEIDSKDAEKAKPIIAAHNGTVVAAEPTIEEKLTWVGLSINDLKAALGI